MTPEHPLDPLHQHLIHVPGCDSIGSLPGDCPCGLRGKLQAAMTRITLMQEACTMIVAVRHCMMFGRVHADFSVQEVLDQYEVSSIQMLAKKAQDAAEAALAAAAEVKA